MVKSHQKTMQPMKLHSSHRWIFTCNRWTWYSWWLWK